MNTILMILALASGADIWTRSNSDINFKEGGTTKAAIKAGGFVKTNAVATASLPAACTDGSIVWDSTLAIMKVCKSNVWDSLSQTGELTEHHASSTITLTSQNTYYQWATSAVGDCNEMTCSATTDDITAQFAGLYLITAHFSGSINAVNQIVEMDLFVEGAENDNCGISTKFAVSGDEQAMSWSCLTNLSVNDSLTLRFENTTSAGKTLTIQHATLTATRVR